MKEITFPEVSGKNLKRKKYDFPRDFPAKRTIVLMAFYRHQQMDIDTWLPYVVQLESEHQDVAYVELPVIYKMNTIGQFMLNEGMRAGIPDPKARENTITLYLDKPQFLEQLEIASQNEVQILLVGDEGVVLWRAAGVFNREKGVALSAALHQDSPTNKNKNAS